jgi:translocation and assembly module TamA
LPVKVALTPRARKKLAAGLGFATDSGPRLRLDWENRQINSLGHTLGAGAELSGIRQGLSLNYGVPRDTLDERFDYQTSVLREETDTALETSFKLGVQHSFQRGDWLRNVFARYQGSAFEIGGEESTSNLILVGANWTRTRRDDPVYPTQGSRLFFELQASDPLISSTWLVQGRAQAKWLRPLGTRHSLLLRGDVGATWVGDFDQLPASLRYFTGGDDSVRGYSYNTLSPEDAAGVATGGRYLLAGSVEYQRKISGAWGAAVFYDTGGAFNEAGDELSHAVGLGARWRSPVGPVSIDLAFGLGDESSIRLHLRLGPDL